MRLSKTRRETIREHQGQNIGEQALKDLRSKRKALRKQRYKLEEDQTLRLNPKKDKSARRKRPKVSMGQYVFRYLNTSKYTPTSVITKKKK